jgi:hypothetical protein
VYLLYVDESDTTDDEPAASRYYCVCGISVVARSYGATTDRINALVAKWEPQLPADFEIKGIDLFQRDGFWKGRDPDERIAFARALTAVLSQSKVRIYVALKESAHFTDDYRKLLGEIIARAAKDTAMKGSPTSKQMLLVFDQRPDFNVRESDELRAARAEVVSRYDKACRFIDHGYEADSKYAPLIQAADFVAYHMRRRETLSRDTTLFGDPDDVRLIALLDEIAATLRPKMKLWKS